tara:strand:- start:538 stop:1755 length:1218 start_codon:yes stop_codon:yes gene_type:complete
MSFSSNKEQNYDVVIIGGGIVGLTTAYSILKNFSNKKLLIIEKEKQLGYHQTSHNSGVIHSGIYYKPKSLKAINCRNGIKLLKSFCDHYSIKYEICGKLIIAKNINELSSLNYLKIRGEKNGIKGLKIIPKNRIAYYEPYVKAESALYCPETGIIDYNDVTQVLSKIINPSRILLNHKVIKLVERKNEIIIQAKDKEIKTKFIINCAGLFSDFIAKLSEMRLNSKIIPFRGEYYLLNKEARSFVKNLVYPVPNPSYPFLGVHFTRSIHGHIEAGPNAVLAFAREGYNKYDINILDMFDYLSYPGFWKMASKYWPIAISEYKRSFSKSSFLNSLREIIPIIKNEHISSSPAGVRAQALGENGDLLDDFQIKQSNNMIHVINAPSPAATSSFSIGNFLKDLYIKIDR